MGLYYIFKLLVILLNSSVYTPTNIKIVLTAFTVGTYEQQIVEMVWFNEFVTRLYNLIK